MAWARRKKDLRYAFTRTSTLDVIEKINKGDESKWHESGIYFFKQWLEGGGLADDNRDRLLRLLRAPVAVFPNRMNPRMTSQLAMVMVCGGKVAPRSIGNSAEREVDQLPSFEYDQDDLESLNENEEEKFLKSFVVRRECKGKIRTQLARIGIHEAALFPEIDHVGNFVRKQWILSED
jgi:hypothetical protein